MDSEELRAETVKKISIFSFTVFAKCAIIDLMHREIAISRHLLQGDKLCPLTHRYLRV